MKNALSFATLALVSIAVTGCASMSVSQIMGDSSPSTVQAQTYQDLSMPPDLQLHPPGQATSYSAQTAAASPASQPVSAPKSLATANPAQPQGDVYEQNGISRYRADGTKKTDTELNAELRKLFIAKKQQQNPNYGTVFNIGNIFGDG